MLSAATPGATCFAVKIVVAAGVSRLIACLRKTLTSSRLQRFESQAFDHFRNPLYCGSTRNSNGMTAQTFGGALPTPTDSQAHLPQAIPEYPLQESIRGHQDGPVRRSLAAQVACVGAGHHDLAAGLRRHDADKETCEIRLVDGARPF